MRYKGELEFHFPKGYLKSASLEDLRGAFDEFLEPLFNGPQRQTRRYGEARLTPWGGHRGNGPVPGSTGRRVPAALLPPPTQTKSLR